MTKRLTDEELAELERLDGATWPAPWGDVDIAGGMYLTCESGGVERRIGPAGYDALLAARNALPSLLAEVRESRTKPAYLLDCPRCDAPCKAIPAARTDHCGYCSSGTYGMWTESQHGVCECGAALTVSVHDYGCELVAQGFADECDCEGYGVDDDGNPCGVCATYADARKAVEGGAR